MVDEPQRLPGERVSLAVNQPPICDRTHCGTSLAPSSSPLKPTYRTPDAIPPPPPGYAEALPLTQPQRRQYKRTVGGTILSLLLYLWGVFCFSFGLAGALLSVASGTSTALVFIGCLVVGLVLLIPLLLNRKQLFLSLWVRLLMEVGLTIIGFLVLLIAAGAHSGFQYSAQANYLALGRIIAIYGLAAAFVAFW